MKRFVKLTAALLAVAIVLSACGGDTSWVFRSGNDQVSAGLYILYQVGAFSQAGTVLAEENKDNPDYKAPETAELLKATIEGKTGADYINDTASQSAREGFVVNKRFDELGISLTDANNYSIESNVSQTMSQDAVFYEKNGVSQDSVRAYYTIMAKRNEVFLKLYGENGEFAVPVSEMEGYFSSNYAVVDVMVMSKPYTVPEGETATLEELVEDVRTTAENYKEMLADGQEIEQLMYDWELKNAEGAESESVVKPEEGELRMVLSGDDRSTYGDAIVDAALNAKVGEPELIEDEYYFVLLVRSDSLADKEIFESYRSVVLSKLKYEEYLAKLAGWAAEVQVDTNSAAINRYKPSNIDFKAGETA